MNELTTIQQRGMAQQTQNHAVALAAAVLDKRIATAKNWPRSVSVFKEQATELLQSDVETAMSAEYSKPVGGGSVRGPSVRRPCWWWPTRCSSQPRSRRRSRAARRRGRGMGCGACATLPRGARRLKGDARYQITSSAGAAISGSRVMSGSPCTSAVAAIRRSPRSGISNSVRDCITTSVSRGTTR